MNILRPPIVGIFSSCAMAEHAIEDLKDAGYSNSEIRYSGCPAKGHLLGNLVSKVEGEEPPPPDEIARELIDMGIPGDIADYYAREFATGHPLVAVDSPGHEQDAIVIFRSNGGHPYKL